jgi:hypothetical protein
MDNLTRNSDFSFLQYKDLMFNCKLHKKKIAEQNHINITSKFFIFFLFPSYFSHFKQ